jgi:hypothetical protein
MGWDKAMNGSRRDESHGRRSLPTPQKNRVVLAEVISPHHNDNSGSCDSASLGYLVSVTLYMWSLSTQLEQILENKVSDWGLNFSWRHKKAASLGKEKNGGNMV